MDFLQLRQKRFLIFGLANKKSVAFSVAKMLAEQEARCTFVVRDESIRSKTAPLFPQSDFFTCDVESEEAILDLRREIEERCHGERFHGLLHSLAFADYSGGMKPFHRTPKKAFLQAIDISCFSLIALSNAFADLLAQDASVVTVSISTTRMASENYGFMAPVKAALDSSLAFLAKSFSEFSEIRFNAVAPSLLKTSASAGIPGYLDSYLYAESVIPRRRALATEEAAATAVFLLSPRSSGITAQKIVVDAGMEINYFDKHLIAKATGPATGP
ncbi:MAG TPA: enoyl-ACP reductase [Planctomycetaceae bacterium]|nr:enoyl-ACP reductase [Planctomycetaceae bacterium]